METLWKHLVCETKKYFKNAGYDKAVIGLSGGIDSTVVACIACEALGSNNVTGVTMPASHSDPDDTYEAMSFATQIGMHQPVNVLIEYIINQFEERLYCHVGKCDIDIANENLQSRIRSVIIMYLCNVHNALMLNTCNKSEEMVGYSTLGGDSMGAIAPIGDLYKTEVYALAEYINKNTKYRIPESIMIKEPSAGLAIGQTDIEDLGVPSYRVLDMILKDIKNGHINTPFNYSTELYEHVLGLVNGSAFKRDPLPYIIKGIPL